MGSMVTADICCLWGVSSIDQNKGLVAPCLMIISKPGIEDANKSMYFLWTSSVRFVANSLAHDLQKNDKKC